MDTPPMRFIRAQEYYDALRTGIPKARTRVIINAIDIRWGPKTDQLIPLLIDAAKRGLEVRIVSDIYSRLRAQKPSWQRLSGLGWKAVLQRQEQLRAGGVQIQYLRSHRLNPYAGHCHTKVTLLDDRIFTFGGVNLSDDSFEQADYMLEMYDPILADRLYRLVRIIEKAEAPTLPDLEEQLGGQATVLFDGGTPKQSIIYDTAVQLVTAAKKVYFVSQMCPSGKLAKALQKTDYQCYFIKPRQTDFPDNVGLWFDQHRYHIQNSYTGNRYIHAKFILTEDKNGQKHVLSGSNNFSYRGVRFGTKEIAVHSTGPGLWQAFYDFMQQDIIGQPAPQDVRRP